jgi:formate dehydrogenase subunit gamma
MKLSSRFNRMSAQKFVRRGATAIAIAGLGLAMSYAAAQAPTAPAATPSSPPVVAAPVVAAPSTATNTTPPTATPPAAEARVAPVLPSNSTAKAGWNVPPKWSDVEMKGQYASIPGAERNVLIEDSGHEWRTLRNGPLTFYGGIALLVVPALLLLFYFIKGPFRLHEKPTGRLIERFNSAERMVHWTMAFSFLALALTGLIILFGKYVLLPVIGASAFAWITNAGKVIHNFVGPLFIFSLITFFILYVRDNFFNGQDIKWLSKFGGLLSGNHVPSGRFNGGEKTWFWLSIVILGLAVSISGVIMLFPNWNPSRELMAQSNLIHAGFATLFVALSFGHIYIGTIGTEGALQGMRTGHVDETWAKEHHALWAEEMKSGQQPGKAPNVSVATAAGDD